MFAIYLILSFVSIITLINAKYKDDQDRIIHSSNMNLNDKVNQFEKVRNSMDFTGKVALVTGSNSGIGAETVRLLSYLGAQVVVTGRDQGRIKEVAKECWHLSPHNYRPLGVAADLTHIENMKQLVSQTVEAYGKIDILVNVAGIGKNAEITDANYTDVFNEVTAINEVAAVQLTQIAAPYLKQTNGTVIFIASVLADTPIRSGSSYGMSKAALVLLTKTLALELGPNIRVNAISPGLILGTRIYRPAPSLPEEAIKVILSNTPLCRNGVPLDVAKGIVFLASPLANWIDGTNLYITGGNYGGI